MRMSTFLRSFLQRISKTGCLLIILSIALLAVQQTTVSFDQKLYSSSARSDVFYRIDNEPGFIIEDRISFFSKAGIWRRFTHTFTSFGFGETQYLRIDPTMAKDRGAIRNLSMNGLDISFTDLDIFLNELEVRVDSSNVLYFQSSGSDPYFLFSLERTQQAPVKNIVALIGGTVGFLLVLTQLIIPAKRMKLGSLRRAIGLASPYLTCKSIVTTGVVASAAVLISGAIAVAHITPPLQGPDEIVHVGNSYSTFHNLYVNTESSATCPQVTNDINQIFNIVQGIRNHPEESMTKEKLEALILNRLDFSNDLENEAGLNARQCETSNFFHRYVYNIYPYIASQMTKNYDSVEYMRDLRLGNILTAFALLGLIGWTVIAGQSVAIGLPVVAQSSFRRFFLLSFCIFLAIPQNLFMISVISKEAYFIPLGVFCVTSLFYVHRILSPILMICFIVACWPRRAPYLLMLAVPVVHYLHYLVEDSKRRYFQLLFPISVIGFLLIPVILLVLAQYAESLPFRFPPALMISDDFFHFYKEAWRFLHEALTLQIIKESSFFGVLGSMDAPVHSWMPAAFRLFLYTIILASLAYALINKRAQFLARFYNRSSMSLLRSYSILSMALVPLVASIITYTAFQVYYSPDLGLNWGVGIQGRYYLPMYFFIFAYLLVLSGSLISSCSNMRSNQGDERISPIFIYFLISFLILALISLMCFWTVDVLVDRYFHDASIADSYLQFISD